MIAIVGGMLIEKLRMEKYVENFYKKCQSCSISDSPALLYQKDRFQYAKEQVAETFLESNSVYFSRCGNRAADS